MTRPRSETARICSDERGCGDTLRARVDASRLAVRWEITGLLSEGADRAVFLATDRSSGERIVLKVADSREVVQAPRQEYLWLSTAGHSHLPRVYGGGSDEAAGLAFVALELVEGDDLLQAIRRGGVALALELLWQACSTLSFLHEGCGILHGDVKPDNLLVRDRYGNPELVVIDLGLSSRVGEGKVGVVRGTPRYAAPSVLAGEPPTPGSDVFALGASFREAASEALAAEPGEGGLRAILERMVESDPDSRYASAGAVLRDLRRLVPAAVREASVAGSEPVFVGRAAELEAAEAWLSRLARGRTPTGLFVVSGEAGSGRSRLLAEITRRANLAGIDVHPCRPRFGARANQPIVDAVEPLVRGRGDGERLKALLSGARSDADRVAALDLLADVSHARPSLFVLDDVQIAEAATLALLRAASRPATDVPFAFLVAVLSGSEAERSLSRAAPERVELGRLAPDETRALLRSLLLPVLGGDDLAQRIAQVTEGHPRFAASAARAVCVAHERGELDLDRIFADVLPQSLSEALDRELDQLTAEEEAVALAAAITGRGSTAAELLGSVASPGAELAVLVERGVLQTDRSREDPVVEVRSELLRNRLLTRASVERRALLHARTADRLERLAARSAESGAGGTDGGEHAVAIVEHRLAAGDALVAAPFAVAAARSLLGDHDPNAVLRMSSALLRASGLDADTTAALREARGDAFLQLGELDSARAVFEDLIVRAETDRAGCPPRLLRKSASALQGLGLLRDARSRLVEALSADGQGEERAAACELMGLVEYERGHADEAKAWFLRGLEALDDVEHSVAASQLLNNLGTLAIARSLYEEAREYHERALAVRERCGDLEGRARSLTNLGTVGLYTGRLSDARRNHEEALSIKRRLGNRQSIALSLSNLAVLDHWVGNYGSAISRYEEAVAIRIDIGDVVGEVRSRSNLAEVWRDKGDLARALEHARLALARAAGRADVSRVEAHRAAAGVELDLGRLDRARRFVHEGIARARACDARDDEAHLWCLAGEVSLVAADGDPEEPGRHAVQALALARELDDPRTLATALLFASSVRLAEGKPERARSSALSAIDLARKSGLRSLSARAELLLGQVALSARRPDEASRHLQRAQEEATLLATPELEWRTASALAAFHHAHGRQDRALIWLERCVSVFRGVVARLRDPALETAYLDSPNRAAVLRFLEDALA